MRHEMQNCSRFLAIYAWCFSRHGRYHIIFIMMEAVADQSRRVRDFFSGTTGRQNYDRLVAFALKKVVRSRFFNSSSALQPPEHYVNESILRCLPGADGQVARDLNREQPLEVMFRGIIESVISHDEQPSAIRRKTRAEFGFVEDSSGSRQLSPDDFESSFWNDKKGDVEIRAKAIRQLDERPVLESFIKFVSKDDVVHRMVLLLVEEDIEEPAELVASRVGITVAEVYVARKRLGRLLRQFGQEARNL
jgi:hypothetical protein